MTKHRDIPRILISLASLTVSVVSLYFLFRPETPSETPADKAAPIEGGLGLSDEEKEIFVPSSEWRPVKDNHVCPPGLEYRLNMTDGSRFARLIS